MWSPINDSIPQAAFPNRFVGISRGARLAFAATQRPTRPSVSRDGKLNRLSQQLEDIQRTRALIERFERLTQKWLKRVQATKKEAYRVPPNAPRNAFETLVVVHSRQIQDGIDKQ